MCTTHGYISAVPKGWALSVLMVFVGLPQITNAQSMRSQELSVATALALPVKSGSDEIELTATWQPFGESHYKFGERWKTLIELKPAQATQVYPMSQLAVLLPQKESEIGEIYSMDVKKLIPVLKQFHEGATHRLHHGGPRGAYGCVTAENERFMRIETRLHAEFNLHDGYYTPSQFAGDFIVERENHRIVAFKLAVPPRKTNVDVNWEWEPAEGEKWADAKGNLILAKATTIADIGFCKEMQLIGGDCSILKGIKWDRQLPAGQAQQSFREKFYASSKIPWLPWEEAVAASKKTGKPLHVVALFGSLDDESC